MAWAGPESGIQRHLDAGAYEKAQQKCQRLNASATSQPRPLREVCATAMWKQAEKINNYAGWVKFRTEYAGTRLEPEAHTQAAAAKLLVIGEQAAERTYLEFLKEFSDTRYGEPAKDLAAQAAFRDVKTVDRAVYVAKTYPAHPGLEGAIQPWFEAFVKVQTDGNDITVRLDPELPIPGARLAAEWAGRFDADPVPLKDAIEQHLGELGVPKALVGQYADSNKVPSYPPCSVHDMDLGVHITYGSLSSFHEVERSCGGKDPVFVAEEHGRLVGISVAPGISTRFGNGERPNLEWVSDGLRTSIPLLGPSQGDVVMVGSVLGHQVGPLWMLHPIAGGMPWYVKEEPPPSAKPLPSTLISVPVPADVQLVGTPSGDTRLEKPGSPTWTRTLPPGKVRVLSPWLAEVTGLHSRHEVFSRPKVDPLPKNYEPDWRPLPDASNRAAVRTTLAGFGVSLGRAWEVFLQGKGPSEVLFEGTFKGDAVKGVLDPRQNGTHRLFIFHSPKTGDPLVFSYQDRTWVAFRSDAGVETLAFEPRGLARRLLK